MSKCKNPRPSSTGHKVTTHRAPKRSAANAATNAKMQRAGAATPRKQPTPGQMVAAGIINAQ
jgi:hypothetical protein